MSNSTMNNNTTVPTTPPPDLVKQWLEYFIHNAGLIILGLLIICANATILIVFSRKRPLKITTNFFLIAIAFSDFMVGLVSIPTYMACNITYNIYVCETQFTLSSITSLCTISFIAVITADRYIAIMKPLRYKALITKKRAKLIIAIVMVISVILSLLQPLWATGKLHSPTAGQRRADFIYTICILFPMITVFPLMVYAYIRIFMEIRRQHKLDQEHERLHGGDSRATEREIRTICVFAVMMMAYVFCWMPLAIVRVNLYFTNSRGRLPVPARYIIMLLPFVTSFLNPCCYGLGKKDFRSALSECSSCCRSLKPRKPRRNDTCTTVC